MHVPDTIEQVIVEFDRKMEPLDTHVVQAALFRARTKLEDKIGSGEGWSDLAAFGLQAEQEDREPWGTYFGPMGSWQMNDGSTQYNPDPRDVTPDILDHWATRADALAHPVLKARYADLVWDYAPQVAKRRRDVRFARIAIDAYLASVFDGKNPDDHDDVQALQRALELSTRLRDEERTAAAKEAMLARFHVEVDKDGWWLHLFQTLTGNKKCGLGPDERDGMVAKLEKRLAVYVAEETLDPHGAERVANYILPIYSTSQDFEAVRRVGLAVAGAFERIASAGSRIQAMAWLQTAAEFARRAGDADRYRQLRVDRETAIRESASEMKSFHFSHEIAKAEVDEVIDILIDDGNWQQTLFNIAAQFIPAKQALRLQADESKKASPLMSMFSTSVVADDHVAAQIGGDDDADAALFQQADYSRQTNRLFLTKSLDAAIERHSLSPEEIAAFIQRSSMFSEFPLLVAGVKAWMEGDYVKCMFVLVPQVEDAFRNIARRLGEAVTKEKRGQRGWEVSMNLGDLLAMESVKTEVGEDIHFWIKAMLSDARGMNLRNLVAHGLAGREVATYYTCDAIIHCMLVLGAYKDVAVSCARRSASRKQRSDAEQKAKVNKNL
ncbi:UNVERIFIED_ORG: lysyl-tRNA synthetase class 1 [Rhizobium aethiopicum]